MQNIILLSTLTDTYKVLILAQLQGRRVTILDGKPPFDRMFRQHVWAVGSYSSGLLAAGTMGNKSTGRFLPSRFVILVHSGQN